MPHAVFEFAMCRYLVLRVDSQVEMAQTKRVAVEFFLLFHAKARSRQLLSQHTLLLVESTPRIDYT